MGSAVTSCQSVVCVCTGHDPLWVSFDPSGHSQGGGYIELGPDETHGQLQITLQSGRRFVAGGATAIQQLWQVSCASMHTCTTLMPVYADAELAYAVNCNETIHCTAPVCVEYVLSSFQHAIHTECSGFLGRA